MSWKLKRKAQGTLAEEQGTIRKDWGGKISVALVYPNTYAVGMSNLGFQTIYRHLNAIPDVVRRLGHEHALADDVGNRVEVTVDGLEAEVRHADGRGGDAALRDPALLARVAPAAHRLPP